jgi:hypothetical protein
MNVILIATQIGRSGMSLRQLAFAELDVYPPLREIGKSRAG